MGAVKALTFLEWKALINKIKHYQKYKFQTALIVFGFVLLVIAVLTIPGGQQLEFSHEILSYSELIIGGFILFTLMLQIIMVKTRFPVNLPGDSPTLLLSTSLSTRGLIMYYLVKQFFLQAFISLFMIYSTISLFGGTLLPQGYFLAWIGLLLFSMWATALTLLVYGILRRFSLDGTYLWGSILLIIAVIFTVSGANLQAFWDIIHPQRWWPASGFYLLVYNVFQPVEYSLWPSVLGLVSLNLITLTIAFINLEYTREELSQEVYRNKQIKDKQNKIADPDEAMLIFFGAKRDSWIANQPWRPGIISALVWKDMVTCERLKPAELKFSTFSCLIFGGICGLLYHYMELPLVIILLLPLLNCLGGGKPSIGVFHSITCQLPGSWFRKLVGVTTLPALEGVVYHTISLIAMVATILFLEGMQGVAISAPILTFFLFISLPLNLMATILGVLGHLLSFRFVGFLKISVMAFPAIFHIAVVMFLGEFFQWEIGVVLFIAISSLLLYGFWLWISSVYLTANFAKLRES